MKRRPRCRSTEGTLVSIDGKSVRGAFRGETGDGAHVLAGRESGAQLSGRSELPHRRLVAYHVAIELLIAIKAAKIRDARLRDAALRAGKSARCDVAEAAGRVTRPDKGRAFAIARGEGIEAFAALETAAAVGDADEGE